ncbi:transcriptional regulator [Streptomyces sp. NPDC096538]|uniref:AfsR/SARP family transcriptional regulator n=1 Tax=Streptomyces sp. NPDC096538 TaxID=3155427 RepID=UPI003330518C
MCSDIQFSVLGPVRLLKQGVEKTAGQPRQCAVLAALLFRAGRPVSLSTLVGDVWGEEAPPSALGSVRTYVYRLRQALSEQSDRFIRLVNGGYLLHIEPDALDLNRFKQTVAMAREARSSGALTLAERLLSKALDMWHGDALTGVPGPFASTQRSVLGDLRLACAEEYMACQVGRGCYVEAAAELSTLLAAHPLRERVCGLLMTALYGAGRQAEALAAYQRTSNLLRQKLGLNPSPELQQVHKRILSGRWQLSQSTIRRSVGRTTHQVPAELPAALPHLVGRDKEQEQLERWVHETEASSPAAICVISGLAGIGKTAFAVSAGRRLARHFPDGQLFADLHGGGPESERRGRTEEVLADFLQSLGVPPKSVPETTQARGLLFQGLLARRRMLIVLDNAQSTDQLKDLLPQSPGSMALVTTRTQLRALVAAYQALPLTLLPLTRDAARSFLTHRLGTSRTEAEPETVDGIIQSAGGVPLALANIAARAIYRPQVPLANLTDEYIPSEDQALDTFNSEEDWVLNPSTSDPHSHCQQKPSTAPLLQPQRARPGAVGAANSATPSQQRVRQTLLRLVHAGPVSEVASG